MIKLRTLITEGKLSYVGDCRSIVNHQTLFSDATQMAQAVENSIPITYDKFITLVDLSGTSRMFHLNLRKHPDWFTFGKHESLVWAYDGDIHFFFV